MSMAYMRQPRRDHWGKTSGEVFDELLRDRGITRYSTFRGSAEGEELPSGIESVSRWILTPDETVQVFMLEWDQNRSAPDRSKGYYILRTSGPWSQERLVREATNPNFLRARKELALALTERQVRILREWEESTKLT